MGKVIDGIVGLAYAEWEFFGRQEFDIDGNRMREGMDEAEEGFWQRVGLYWREGTGKNFTGRDDDIPWSAAFISYIMRKAGADGRFRFNALHSVYIRKAIKARQQRNRKYGFWGFQLFERSPEVGDLVCYAREPGISFDTQSANYKSHADIVVSKSDHAIQVIGGNVGSSVSLKTLRIEAGGILIDKRYKWFAVLQNRLDTA